MYISEVKRVMKVKKHLQKRERKVIRREEEGSDRPHPDTLLLFHQSLTSIQQHVLLCFQTRTW